MALLDILAADKIDNYLLVTYKQVVESIRQHIERLLNARRGTLMNNPEYGLFDLENSCYQNLPYDLKDLTEQVCKLVKEYEPRVRHPNIAPNSEEKKSSIVRLDMTAWVLDEKYVTFEIYFYSYNKVRVVLSSEAKSGYYQ